MYEKPVVSFVISHPKRSTELWRYDCYTLMTRQYVKATNLATNESFICRVIEPKGEAAHFGNWKDSRRCKYATKIGN